MICKSPISTKHSKGALFPCGQCLPCTINSRRVWTHRIMLEAAQWPQNAFITLTFRDDCLPENGVSVTEHQEFMQKLRDQWRLATGQLIRFYMCGEYGDRTFRPHYHYAVFNFPPCVFHPRKPFVNGKYVPCNCHVCGFVTKVWGKGHVFIGSLEADSAQYVAGYVTKKMTKKDDPRLEKEIYDNITGEISKVRFNPEFSRSSRRPGIGASSVPGILEKYYSMGGLKGQDGSYQIPTTLRQGNRYMPLGRYLKGKLENEIQTEKASLAQIEARQMFGLLKGIKDNPSLYSRAIAQGSAGVAMQLVNSQRCLSIEQRFKRKGKSNEI